MYVKCFDSAESLVLGIIPGEMHHPDHSRRGEYEATANKRAGSPLFEAKVRQASSHLRCGWPLRRMRGAALAVALVLCAAAGTRSLADTKQKGVEIVQRCVAFSLALSSARASYDETSFVLLADSLF